VQLTNNLLACCYWFFYTQIALELRILNSDQRERLEKSSDFKNCVDESDLVGAILNHSEQQVFVDNDPNVNQMWPLFSGHYKRKQRQRNFR